MTTRVRVLTALIPGACLLLLLSFSIRLLVADVLARYPSLHARELAVGLVPGNVSYTMLLADLRRQQDLDIREQLVHATHIDPANARMYIELGLECERAGDTRAALGYLMEANKLSNEFLPRWTLANFYFRQDDSDRFLLWMNRALEIGTRDLQPAFRLLWNAGLTPRQIESVIPMKKESMVPYFDWLIQQHHLDAAPTIADLVLNRWATDGLADLQAYCSFAALGPVDQQLHAVTIWNALCARGLIHKEPVFPACPPHVVNARFASAPTALPFDWLLSPTAGTVFTSAAGSLGIYFDGNEPESYVLLSQLIPLKPGANYVLQCEYDATGIPRGSGLSWRVDCGDHALSGAPVFLNDNEHSVDVPFTVPGNCPFVRVNLVYARQPGTVRLTGSLRLKRVHFKS